MINPMKKMASAAELEEQLGFTIPLLPAEVTDYIRLTVRRVPRMAEIRYADGSIFRMARGSGDISGIYGGRKENDQVLHGVKVTFWVYDELHYALWETDDFTFSLTGQALESRVACLLENTVPQTALLEEMRAFFEARLESYDQHMLDAIEGARVFYPFTASCLPKDEDCSLLDLGCGTGLELEYYFPLNPTAQVTGIDLSEEMLWALENKFPDQTLWLMAGSYFDIPFGENRFDAAVSVESLHHFTKDEKIPLYTKLRKALKPEGYFILTDYFARTAEEEQLHRQELLRLKREQGIVDDGFYHYDTPLTVEHETEALLTAGFSSVEVLGQWGATVTLKAVCST